MISNDRNLMAAIIVAGYAARDSLLSAEEVVRRSFEVADAILGTDHTNVPEVPEVPKVPSSASIERIPTDPIPDVSEIEEVLLEPRPLHPARPHLHIIHYKPKPKP